MQELIEEYRDDFRRIMGLKPADPIPAGLVTMFNQYKRRVDICSAGTLTAKELILLVTVYEASGCAEEEVKEVEELPETSEPGPPEEPKEEGAFK
jgi:hypothetical protein